MNLTGLVDIDMRQFADADVCRVAVAVGASMMMVTEEPEARRVDGHEAIEKGIGPRWFENCLGIGEPRLAGVPRGKPGRFGRGVVGENDAWSRFHVFRFGGEHLLAGQLLLLEPKRLPQFAPHAEELFAIRRFGARMKKKSTPPQVTAPKSPRQCGGN